MQYQQSDPAKMHSRLLANKMKKLKSVDEEVSKMCNIVEEYVAERLAEEKAKLAEAEAELAEAKSSLAKKRAEAARAEAKAAKAEAKAARAEAKVAEAEKKAATAKANSNLNCIKNLMKSMQLSAENAMHAIGIPPAEHVHYLAML